MKSCVAEGSRKVAQSLAKNNRRKVRGRIFIRTDFVHALKSTLRKVLLLCGRFAEANNGGEYSREDL